MKTGLLWYDDDKTRTLDDKVQRAADHYRKKFGRRPTVCYVNPRSLSGGPERVAGIRVEARHNVLLHHFWIGVED